VKHIVQHSTINFVVFRLLVIVYILYLVVAMVWI